jgi:hypothetical protein
MNFIVNFLQNVNNFFIGEQLYIWYFIFIFFIVTSIFTDIYSLKNNIKSTIFFKIIPLLFLIFFTSLYIYFSEYINGYVENYMMGEYSNDIKQSNSISAFYINKIGNLYIIVMIVFFSMLYLYFFKLQSFLQSKKKTSFFLTLMLFLNFFSILIFIEQLRYSHFTFSESIILHLDMPTYFFSLLNMTSLIIFSILYILTKEKIPN